MTTNTNINLPTKEEDINNIDAKGFLPTYPLKIKEKCQVVGPFVNLEYRFVGFTHSSTSI